MNKIFYILILISVDKSISVSSKIVTRERFKHLGDICQLHDNPQPGLCKLVNDCMDYFKNATQITLCGFDRTDSIICCPQTQITEYKNFTSECVVQGTNENGFYKLIEHCPRIKEEVRKGAPFPTVCNYEICKDMVCCPVGGLKRKNEVCFQFDDVSYIIPMRIRQEAYCTINGKLGIYKSKSGCNISGTDASQRVCDYDFCKDIVCCPFADVSIDHTLIPGYIKFLKIVGGSCVDKITGESGICKTAVQCRELNEFSLLNVNRRNYTTCGFEFCTQLICCPNQSYNTKSLQACEVYKEAVFESVRNIPNLRPTIDDKLQCSAVSPAGGNRASPKQFPNIAALGYQKRDEPIIWNCGGSLISDRFVLTAAHCVNPTEFGPVQFVRLGALTIDQPDTLGCPEEFQVIERILHPSYNVSGRYNDIALLKLDRIVQFTPHIRPACLPTVAKLPENGWFTAMGWGQTGFAAPRTDWLVYVRLQEYNNTVCNTFFEDANRLPLGIVEETQFCAGSSRSIDDTCPGDSGGPLQKSRHYEMAEVLGITSFGNACGFQNSPGVYTRVFPYVKWIEGIVWK